MAQLDGFYFIRHFFFVLVLMSFVCFSDQELDSRKYIKEINPDYCRLYIILIALLRIVMLCFTQNNYLI